MVLGSIGISVVVDVGAEVGVVSNGAIGSSVVVVVKCAVVGSVGGLSVGASSVVPGDDTVGLSVGAFSVAPGGVPVPCMVVDLEGSSVTESDVDSVGNSVGASSVEELVCSVGSAVVDSGIAVDGS